MRFVGDCWRRCGSSQEQTRIDQVSPVAILWSGEGPADMERLAFPPLVREIVRALFKRPAKELLRAKNAIHGLLGEDPRCIRARGSPRGRDAYEDGRQVGDRGVPAHGLGPPGEQSGSAPLRDRASRTAEIVVSDSRSLDQETCVTRTHPSTYTL